MKKVSKNNNNKEKGILNDKVLVILIGILVVLSLIIIGIKIATRNNLKLDSELVTELHEYFSSEDLSNCEGLFTYADDKVEYSDVNSESRLCLAYQKTELTDVEIKEYKPKKKETTCDVDGMIFRVDEETETCSVSIIDKEVINKTYKKIFGKDIEDDEEFKVDNLNICYLKDDKYYCGLSETFTYTLGNESVIYRVIEKAIEKGSEVIIYDYFAKINDDTCFANYTTTTINEKCTNEYKEQKEINYKFMKNYATQYKHVFKLADDGTYYWVSSEPIK